MSDQSVELLIQQLPQLRGKCLIVADENWASAAWLNVARSGSCQRILFSNRFEIAASAEQAGIETCFNDFDFSNLEPASFDYLLYRVSKERPVSHHIINSAFTLLASGGKLLLSGEKSDGLKTYADQACKLFGDRSKPQKNGNYYLATITRHSVGNKPLDDKDYSKLRAIKNSDELPLQSKPGIFGWNKIDQGSAFLIEQLPAFLDTFPKSQQPQSLLDLGCGYGYLACAASQQGFVRITATDNNAAAVYACQKNFTHLNISGEVIAADAGSEIQQQFDAIICNPPFHQGFNIEGALTEKFLNACRRLLTAEGKALFVVNNFIPLEKKAVDYFAEVSEVARNNSFKLIQVCK